MKATTKHSRLKISEKTKFASYTLLSLTILAISLWLLLSDKVSGIWIFVCLLLAGIFLLVTVSLLIAIFSKHPAAKFRKVMGVLFDLFFWF